jgi:signal recognition particle subunit SRP54
MTPGERTDPDVIDGSRRARIAAGSGTQPNEINQLVRQFREMRKMMKQMGGKGRGGGASGGRSSGGRGRKGRKSSAGRTTAPGPVPIDKKKGLSLPGLGDGPGGFPNGLDLPGGGLPDGP